MFNLLISIMMSLGIQFTVVDKSEIQISGTSMDQLKASDEFQKSGITSLDGITVSDGVDPESDANFKE